MENKYVLNLDLKKINTIKIINDETMDIIPFLDKELLDYIYGNIYLICKEIKVRPPKTFLDLEQYQVGKYDKFKKLNSNIQNIVNETYQYDYIDKIDFYYLALRSMFTNLWNKPKSNKGMKKILIAEGQIQILLIKVARYLATKKNQKDFLPYWARLYLLKLLTSFPKEQKYNSKIHDLNCIVLKTKDLNASSFLINNSNVVGLDYSLEPLLKFLNSLFFHLQYSEKYAGPNRIKRSFSDIFPFLLYFIHDIPPIYLPFHNCVFFDITPLKLAKFETNYQINFLIAHEIGHIILNHPGVKNSFETKSNKKSQLDIKYLTRENLYEYEADIFAINILRARAFNLFRSLLNPNNSKKKKNKTYSDSPVEVLSDYFIQYASIKNLFLLMNFIEKSTEYLKGVLICNKDKKKYKKTHPSSLDRIKRIEQFNCFDIPTSSGFTSYIERRLSSIYNYMIKLPKEKIFELREVYYSENKNYRLRE